MKKPLLTSRLAAFLSAEMAAYAFTDQAIYFEQPSGSAGLDEHGQPIKDATGTLLSCSFVDDFRAGERERWKPFGDVIQIIAEIRFKSPPIPQKGGRFQLVSKSGTVIQVQKTYEIIFIQDRGVFGYVCALKIGEL